MSFPIWQLEVMDYVSRGEFETVCEVLTSQWGALPKYISNYDYWWGLQNDKQWSFNPLGQEWIAT